MFFVIISSQPLFFSVPTDNELTVACNTFGARGHRLEPGLLE